MVLCIWNGLRHFKVYSVKYVVLFKENAFHVAHILDVAQPKLLCPPPYGRYPEMEDDSRLPQLQ